jgi:uncharacterized protein with PIN domain
MKIRAQQRNPEHACCPTCGGELRSAFIDEIRMGRTGRRFTATKRIDWCPRCIPRCPYCGNNLPIHDRAVARAHVELCREERQP